ncbi:MAG: ZIP family metal transporter [Bryobacteraceae bacterium]
MRNLLILLVLTLASAWLGIKLSGAPKISRRLLPFSGGVLVGVAAFWILPEIGEQYGWLGALCGISAGFGLLWLINRFVYSVCPACSPTHDHAACNERLHGFAAPLITAASLHSFFDGWSLGVANQQASEGVRAAFVVGIGIHKVPEGIALGVLFLAATGSVWKAWTSCAAVQSFMLIGGFVAIVAAPHLGSYWIGALLSIAAGIFIYLGYHAIESEYRARGMLTACVPALTGAAGAAVLRLVPGL